MRIGDGEEVGDRGGAGSGGEAGNIALLACRLVNKETNQDCPPGAGDRDLVRMVLAVIQRKYSD